jgi:hypothetical protein
MAPASSFLRTRQIAVLTNRGIKELSTRSFHFHCFILSPSTRKFGFKAT